MPKKTFLYHHKQYGTFQVDEKILPLVDLLNRFSFITTTSSCQGHYTPDEQKETDQPWDEAHVYFNVHQRDETKLKIIAQTILPQLAPHWTEGTVVFRKRYYALPDEKTITSLWELVIMPFPPKLSPAEKRARVDKTIDRVVYALQHYHPNERYEHI